MGRSEDLPELLGLIDRLEHLRERSALSELELEMGDTTVILRSQEAVAARSGPATAALAVELPAEPEVEPEPVRTGTHAVTAPLTGVFYRSPSPGAEAYVREGSQVSVGQVIGLIEAMKLFNEIKSDVTGTVRALVAGDGDLVKARQTLIEVEPS